MLTATRVERALQALAALQLPDGEFPTYSGRSGTRPDSWRYESSPFVTTFVLHALRDYPQAGEMRELAVGFLCREMEAPGIWRWYTGRGPQAVAPDLDDVVCASAALRRRHPHIFLGTNHALIIANRDPQGRFYTWIGRAPERNDVDSTVNANVLFYLGERDETAAAAAWVTSLAYGGPGGTYRYYTDDSAFWYCLARCAAAGQKWASACADAIPPRVAGDALSLAYHAAALRAVGRPVVPEPLLALQRPDGLWPRTAAYTVPSKEDGHRWDWGSEALTTAIALEALNTGGG